MRIAVVNWQLCWLFKYPEKPQRNNVPIYNRNLYDCEIILRWTVAFRRMKITGKKKLRIRFTPEMCSSSIKVHHSAVWWNTMHVKNFDWFFSAPVFASQTGYGDSVDIANALYFTHSLTFASFVLFFVAHQMLFYTAFASGYFINISYFIVSSLLFVFF